MWIDLGRENDLNLQIIITLIYPHAKKWKKKKKNEQWTHTHTHTKGDTARVFFMMMDTLDTYSLASLCDNV